MLAPHDRVVVCTWGWHSLLLRLLLWRRHRAADVSPHNIYRSASGHPLLADFDAAELLDEDGEVAAAGGAGVVGRLAVAAPEVRAAAYGGGGVYGAKSDMWSLGMVLLEMVS